MEETVKAETNNRENEVTNTAEEGQKAKESFDYRKEREERIKHKTEKALLNEVGLTSLDEIKQKINSLSDYQKQIDELKNEVNKSKINGYKVEALKNGFDERFVDYIVYELKDRMSENEDFSKALKKFKAENGQFLKREDKGIKFSTAPNFESGGTVKDAHSRMNDFFSGKSKQI